MGPIRALRRSRYIHLGRIQIRFVVLIISRGVIVSIGLILRLLILLPIVDDPPAEPQRRVMEQIFPRGLIELVVSVLHPLWRRAGVESVFELFPIEAVLVLRPSDLMF